MSFASYSIWITGKYEAFHRWADAPDEVRFLRSDHRHLFGYRVEVSVTHSDRNVEFFILKRQVAAYVKQAFEGKHFEFSCEFMANMIWNHCCQLGYTMVSVTVDEDGENGATYRADKGQEALHWIEMREEYEAEQREYDD